MTVHDRPRAGRVRVVPGASSSKAPRPVAVAPARARKSRTYARSQQQGRMARHHERPRRHATRPSASGPSAPRRTRGPRGRNTRRPRAAAGSARRRRQQERAHRDPERRQACARRRPFGCLCAQMKAPPPSRTTRAARARAGRPPRPRASTPGGRPGPNKRRRATSTRAARVSNNV